MHPLVAVVVLLRPRHWIKNLFVFAPVFFGRELTNGQLLFRSLVAFFAFSLAASAVYAVNDILDADYDRLHPVKRHRPVAAGHIRPGAAALIALACALISIGTALWLGVMPAIWIKSYLLINLLYSWKLKHIAVLDVGVIATCFLIRILTGSGATGIPLSAWIMVLTFVLALFLGFAKRRDDILILQENGQRTRESIDGYNLLFVQHAMTLTAAVAMVAYMLYTVSPDVQQALGTRYLYLTSIFVFMGLLRYLQRTFVLNRTGSPVTVLLEDRFIQAAIFGWLVLLWVLLYG